MTSLDKLPPIMTRAELICIASQGAPSTVGAGQGSFPSTGCLPGASGFTVPTCLAVSNTRDGGEARMTRNVIGCDPGVTGDNGLGYFPEKLQVEHPERAAAQPAPLPMVD